MDEITELRRSIANRVYESIKPEFLTREEFKEYKTKGMMGKLFFIDGVASNNFITRREVEGKPVRSHLDNKGHRLYRVSDVIASARAAGRTVTPPIKRYEEIKTAEERLADLAAKEEKLKASIEEMEINESKLVMSQALTKKIDLALLSAGEICRAANRDIPRSGVYFLVSGESVVYVGQAVSVLNRIGIHINDPEKEFDGFCFIECAPEKLNLLESIYIHLLRPKYNARVGRDLNRLRAPLSFEALNEEFGVKLKGAA